MHLVVTKKADSIPVSQSTAVLVRVCMTAMFSSMGAYPKAFHSLPSVASVWSPEAEPPADPLHARDNLLCAAQERVRTVCHWV